MADIGHIETEKLLEEMSQKVSGVYAEAVSDTQKKLEDYLRRFEIKDDIKQQQLLDGVITKKQYQEWRTGQIMIQGRWEEMRDTLASDFHNANMVARSVVTGYMPEVYALNHNYATFLVEKGSHLDTSYALYSRQTVERILRDNPDLLPLPGVQMNQTFAAFDVYKAGGAVSEKQKKAFDKLIAGGKDIRWQEGQIQSVMTQAILQGESIPNIAKRIAKTMGETNHASTIRYARTAITGAQNAGRLDAYKRAAEMGVDMEREWLAVHDNRTRHEHRMLDGQRAKVDEPFYVDGYEIMFPGDPAAEGFLIWNCRCTMRPAVKGWDSKVAGLRSNEKMDGMSYDEWKNAKAKSEPITKQEDIGNAMRGSYIAEYRRK